MSKESVGILLEQLASACGLGKLELDDDNACMLAFDDVLVHFEWWPKEDFLCLFSPLGEYPPSYDEEVKRELLDANVLFGGTQGPTLGIPANSYMVTLQWLLPCSFLDFATFEEKLRFFVDTAETWADKLHVMGGDGESDSDAVENTEEKDRPNPISIDPGPVHTEMQASVPMPTDMPYPPQSLMI